MTCNGCNRKATHLVERVPHCQSCMLEALCSVPVAVIDLDCLSLAQRKEVMKNEQFPKTA